MLVPATRVYIPEDDHSLIFEDLREVFSSGMLTLGQYTQRFEEKVSQLLGGQKIVATSSGTSALEIASLSLNLAGGEVIVPSNTFIATALAFARNGCDIVFADCDPYYGCITLDEVQRLHTKQTKAVVMVHIGGIVTPDALKIRQYCNENNLILIEDAAHALGSHLDNHPAGTFGMIGTFSLYPTKVVTSGEGGIITSNHSDLIQEFRIYRDQGKESFHTNLHIRKGSNWRMSEIHATIGYYQVKRLPEFIEKRRQVANAYCERIVSDKLQIIVPENPKQTNWYKIMAMVSPGIDRNQLKEKLAERGVRCGGEVYQIPCHRQPIFKEFQNRSLPNTDHFRNHHLCLPVSPIMSQEHIDYVCEIVNEEISKF